jgi:hypothetical protein
MYSTMEMNIISYRMKLVIGHKKTQWRTVIRRNIRKQQSEQSTAGTTEQHEDRTGGILQTRMQHTHTTNSTAWNT